MCVHAVFIFVWRIDRLNIRLFSSGVDHSQVAFQLYEQHCCSGFTVCLSADQGCVFVRLSFRLSPVYPASCGWFLPIGNLHLFFYIPDRTCIDGLCCLGT